MLATAARLETERKFVGVRIEKASELTNSHKREPTRTRLSVF